MLVFVHRWQYIVLSTNLTDFVIETDGDSSVAIAGASLKIPLLVETYSD